MYVNFKNILNMKKRLVGDNTETPKFFTEPFLEALEEIRDSSELFKILTKYAIVNGVVNFDAVYFILRSLMSNQLEGLLELVNKKIDEQSEKVEKDHKEFAAIVKNTRKDVALLWQIEMQNKRIEYFICVTLRGYIYMENAHRGVLQYI